MPRERLLATLTVLDQLDGGGGPPDEPPGGGATLIGRRGFAERRRLREISAPRMAHTRPPPPPLCVRDGDTRDDGRICAFELQYFNSNLIR